MQTATRFLRCRSGPCHALQLGPNRDTHTNKGMKIPQKSISIPQCHSQLWEPHLSNNHQYMASLLVIALVPASSYSVCCNQLAFITRSCHTPTRPTTRRLLNTESFVIPLQQLQFDKQPRLKAKGSSLQFFYMVTDREWKGPHIEIAIQQCPLLRISPSAQQAFLCCPPHLPASNLVLRSQHHILATKMFLSQRFHFLVRKLYLHLLHILPTQQMGLPKWLPGLIGDYSKHPSSTRLSPLTRLSSSSGDYPSKFTTQRYQQTDPLPKGVGL